MLVCSEFLGRVAMKRFMVRIVLFAGIALGATACASPEIPQFRETNQSVRTGSLTKRAEDLKQVVMKQRSHYKIYHDFFYSNLQAWFDMNERERDVVLNIRRVRAMRLETVSVRPRGIGTTYFWVDGLVIWNENRKEEEVESGPVIIYWLWAERGGKPNWYMFSLISDSNREKLAEGIEKFEKKLEEKYVK